MEYTYSHSLDDIVVASFKWHGKRYVWHDLDCVYYSEESEEDIWMTVPDDAE